MRRIILIALACFITASAYAQGPDEDQLGAWYMYFFNKSFKNSQFGLQGDYQFRYWGVASDQEQMLLRTGFTYRPKEADILFTLGYANITTGTFGDSDATTAESRIYQEALFSQKLGRRFLLTHRIRFEQRWVESQDLRTRYRYNLFMNVPFNDTKLGKEVVYAAFYNELFINGQTDIGDNRSVEYFDRNRTYLGVGYGLKDNLRMQIGWMRQTTVNWAKNQAQFSLHHSF